MLTMSLIIGGKDFVEKIFMPLWIIHHNSIMEGDPVISKASSELGPLIQTFFSELYTKSMM